MTLLTTAQMLYYCGISVDLTLTGLVGYHLTPLPALATLPFALITVGSWLGTYPASRFMRRYGRRTGFLAGSAAAAVGGLVSVGAIYGHSFPLFCVGVGCTGLYQAFAGYYRYAAADLHPAEQRGKAISTVLTGGVVAAVAGPFLATAVKDVLPVEFAGSYALVTVLALLSTTVVAPLTADRPVGGTEEEAAGEEASRPLWRILRQGPFVAGACGACVGFAVMMVAMTAAPIAAVHAGHTVEQGARVIQWHMVGMYATAFVSGPVSRRAGAGWTLLIGALVSGIGAAAATASMSVRVFMLALGLVGIGWNFMYVGGSALIAISYSHRPGERSVVQGLGEVFTLGGSATGALAAGPLLDTWGWRWVMGATLVPLAVSALVTLGHLGGRGPARRPAAEAAPASSAADTRRPG